MNSTTSSNFVKQLTSTIIPASDMESQHSQVNQTLCGSFKAMMKKQQQMDCSTRNTQWSGECQKGHCGAVDGMDQNNVIERQQQKVVCFTTVWKFHDEKKRNDQENLNNSNTQKQTISKNKSTKFSSNQTVLQKLTKSKLTQQKITTIKTSLIQNRTSKITKLRSLLPQHYSTQLPQQVKTLLSTAQSIDLHLSQKKSSQYVDSVHNIFNSLFSEQEMSTIWSMVKKIMFLCQGYYKVRIDPLKNLCVGFVGRKDARLVGRKERLRKAVVGYYLKNKEAFCVEDIPEALVQPVKTTKFYPENLSIQQKSISTKPKPQYIQHLKSSIKQKQSQLQSQSQQLQQSSASPTSELPCPKELTSFCNSISKIYTDRQVGHMYKTSLIQNLRRHSSFSVQKIFSLLKYIQQEGLFLEVLMKSGCQIFRIVQQEKDQLIQVLKLKRKDQEEV